MPLKPNPIKLNETPTCRLGLYNTPIATLQKGTLSKNECPRYDIKQSDGEIPVKLEVWEMQGTPSLLLLPSSLWPGVVAPDRALSMGYIEQICVLMLS